jgi:hypothetical protein
VTADYEGALRPIRIGPPTGRQDAVAQKAMPVGITIATPIRVTGKGECRLEIWSRPRISPRCPALMSSSTTPTARSRPPAGPLTYRGLRRCPDNRLSGAESAVW